MATESVYQNPFEYSTEADWYTQAKIETEKVGRSYIGKDKPEICIVRAGWFMDHICFGPHNHFLA
jgi:hypothetical protein